MLVIVRLISLFKKLENVSIDPGAFSDWPVISTASEPNGESAKSREKYQVRSPIKTAGLALSTRKLRVSVLLSLVGIVGTAATTSGGTATIQSVKYYSWLLIN